MGRTPRIQARLAAILACTSIAMAVSSCAMRDRPIGADRPPMSSGTISGLVRAAGSNAPLAARKVSAVNAATGVTLETSTASNGGYTMKVPVGKYRLQVELRAGESVVEGPTDVEISTSDLDAGRNFVIGVQARPVP
jgi:hypothetical protein